MPEELTLWVVLVAALIDSINPCAIGVLVFLSSVMLKVSTEKKKLLRLGALYIGTVYVIYVLSGLGLVWFQHIFVERGWAETMGTAVGLIVVGLGMLELKEFFWYGKGVSLEIAPRFKKKINQMAGSISVVGMIGLGGFVAVVELPCTGGPYLAITALLARKFDLMAFGYLILYNLIFVLPLFIILLMIYFGFSTRALKKWRQSKRGWMNLGSGILMLVLGLFLILNYHLGWYA